ncbi:MAG: hypothetical protein ABIR70_01640 [Bryobacteraceae bacterium]
MIFAILSILLLPALAVAQTVNLADLLKRSEAASKANGVKADLYAYRERTVNVQLDRDGKEKSRKSETWDVIGLEGSAYRKLIERDDKPLPAKEQKQEEERLAQEATKRRAETAEQRRNRLFSFTYQVSFRPEQMYLFDARLVAEELVNGRPAYVIEATPKPDAKPATSNEAEVLHYKVKRWIDKADLVDSRASMEVVRKGSRMQPGTVVDAQVVRSADGTWLENELRIRYQIRFFKVAGARAEQTTTRSDFHKFEATSRLVDESR